MVILEINEGDTIATLGIILRKDTITETTIEIDDR